MARAENRIAFLKVILGLGGVLIVGRAFQVQVRQHAFWQGRAESRDVRIHDVPARRGSLLDRNGVPLAVTFEAYHLTLAPDQISDRGKIVALLQSDLDIPRREIDRQMRSRFPYFDGPFDAADVQRVRKLRGVHLQAVPRRDYPMGTVAAGILGSTDRATGHGIGGLEEAFDSLLTGTPGRERYLRDGIGRIVPLPDGMFLKPRPGRDVYLTIDYQLQALAEHTLRDAITSNEAMGGDLVVMNVSTGEVLALASLHRSTEGGALHTTPGAIVTAPEPGSTAKIFTAAALLETGADTTPQWGEGGVWQMPYTTSGLTRTIRDTHHEDGLISLGHAIAVSSNIAMSKFSTHLTFAEQYKVLRDFGFGTPLGTGFPGESRGLLRAPYSSPNGILTQASWAQGYEFMASPLQMAVAYAAIANGGHLIAPTFWHAVNSPDKRDNLRLNHADTLRQVVSAQVDQRLREYLQLATDSGGTGVQAQLDLIDVIGKTGTAKIPGALRYEESYRASFAALLPGKDPHFVVYVMIDRPSAGEIYGSQVAAPVVRSLVQQALALEDSPLDVGRLNVGGAALAATRLPDEAGDDLPVERISFPTPAVQVDPRGVTSVPDVLGWTVSDGAFALKRSGFLVRLRGRGAIVAIAPSPGDSVPVGSVVTLTAREDR